MQTTKERINWIIQFLTNILYNEQNYSYTVELINRDRKLIFRDISTSHLSFVFCFIKKHERIIIHQTVLPVNNYVYSISLLVQNIFLTPVSRLIYKYKLYTRVNTANIVFISHGNTVNYRNVSTVNIIHLSFLRGICSNILQKNTLWIKLHLPHVYVDLTKIYTHIHKRVPLFL